MDEFHVALRGLGMAAETLLSALMINSMFLTVALMIGVLLT